MTLGDFRQLTASLPDDYELITDVWGIVTGLEVSPSDSRLNRSGFVSLRLEDDSKWSAPDDPNGEIVPEIGDELL